MIPKSLDSQPYGLQFQQFVSGFSRITKLRLWHLWLGQVAAVSTSIGLLLHSNERKWAVEQSQAMDAQAFSPTLEHLLCWKCSSRHFPLAKLRLIVSCAAQGGHLPSIGLDAAELARTPEFHA